MTRSSRLAPRLRRIVRKQAPLALWAYAVWTVGGSAITSLFTGRYVVVALLLLVLAALISWLVLRGGRIIWSFAVLSQILSVVGIAWGESWWIAGLSVIGLVLLVAPSSRAYIWHEAKLRRQRDMEEQGLTGWVHRISTGVLWEEAWSWISDRVLNWRFVGLLSLFLLLTAFVDGMFFEARDDGWGFAAIERIAGDLSFLALLGLLLLLPVLTIRTLARRAHGKIEREAES